MVWKEKWCGKKNGVERKMTRINSGHFSRQKRSKKIIAQNQITLSTDLKSGESFQPGPFITFQ